MIYNNIRKAEFVIRRNRFICDIIIDGNIEKCHVKNTGRLGELLVPGAEIYVTVSDNMQRKTKYDLITVVKDGKYINVDSFAPNIVVGEYLRRLYPDGKIIAEKSFGNSRFDFYAENGVEKTYIEVKGVTLERDGIVLFPDAPTERGVKHLSELCECIKDGYSAYVLFVIQMKEVTLFRPNDEMHKAFGDALRAADRAGVKIIAMDCSIEPDSIEIDKEVKVVL